MRCPRKPRHDDGFMLVEAMVALVIVTIIMVAVTSVFAHTMRSSTHQRTSQDAIFLVTQQADIARGLSPAAITALAGTPQVVTVAGVQYTIATSSQPCVQAVATSGPTTCVTAASLAPGTPHTTGRNITITASWPDRACDGGTCTYADSILVNDDADPTFPFNDEPPPPPVLSGCKDVKVSQGQVIDFDMRGAEIACTITDGVGPFTWTISALPAGLTLSPDGHVTGTVTADPGTVASTATATDSFLRPSSDDFTWTVLPPFLTRTLWLKSDRTDFPINVSLKNFLTGVASGNKYELLLGPLPPGLSLNTSNGNITGNYNRTAGGDSGDYPIAVKVTDTATGKVTIVGFMYYVRKGSGQSGPGNGMALCSATPLTYTPQIQLTSNPPACNIPGQNLPNGSTSPAVLKVGKPITPFDLWDYTYGQISPYTFKLDAASPSWIQVDPNTGIVTGTPTAATTADWEQRVQFQVYDATGGSYATITVQWKVVA